MEFQKLVEQIISEESMAGGAESVFGSNVGSTATPFSGDNYAPGDARTPNSLYGGILSRYGMSKKKRRKKRKKKRS